MLTSQSEPLVSVVMGVYCRQRGQKLLKRAVDSILRQTYQNLELLICEQGFSGSAKVQLTEMIGQDSRIRLLHGREPGTLAQNLNDCLAVSKGRYIARMDDDDFSHPERLEKQLAYLETHPEIAFVGCNAFLMREGMRVGQRFLPEFPAVRDFCMIQPFLHPALVFRREVLEAADGYSEDRHCILCEDYDLLLRLYAKGFQGANIQDFLFDYTLPPTAKGNRKMSHRWNEAVTRYRRFGELGLLPGALPWVAKPLAVGLLPENVLSRLKKQDGTGGE